MKYQRVTTHLAETMSKLDVDKAMRDDYELMFSLPTSQVFSSISRPSGSYSQPEYPKKNLILP